MTISANRGERGVTLLVEGRVDTNTSPRLQAELLREFQTAKRLTLDFEQVSYISSAGLRVLLIGQKTAAAKGAVMTLAHLQEQVLSVLELSGFHNILTIE